MTLNGYFTLLNSVFVPVCHAPDHAAFKNNCVKTNKGNPHCQWRKYGRDFSFWQYKVCADICVGSLERRHQRRVGSRVYARLELLFLAFKNNCVK